MVRSKLIQILDSFTEEELLHLKQFIQSPLFNSGKRPQKVQLLLEGLARFYPAFGAADIAKEKMFNTVFPGQDFRIEKLDKVASELMQVVRKFIVVSASLNLPETQQWLAQAQYFNKKGLDSEFQHALNQVEKFQQKVAVEEEDFFFTQFLAETEKMKKLISINDSKSDINIPNAIRNLDAYYIITKMIYCSHFLTKSSATYLDSPQSFLLLDAVLETAQKHFLDIPMVATYYYACSLLLKRDQPGDYIKLKNLLETNRTNISPALLRAVHSNLRNYVTEKYNHGDHSSLSELLALLKDHASHGTLLQASGTILASTLQNAVTVALKLDEVEWALGFLYQHRHLIVGADEPEAIFEFNLANCHFHKGDFEAVELCLANYNYREMFYKLAARRMEIKLYYETASPLLDPRLDAFKIFVHDLKSTLPPDKIAPNNHFADLMRQILSPKTLGNHARIQKLLDKLAMQKAVAEREWLQQKLELLLK